MTSNGAIICFQKYTIGFQKTQGAPTGNTQVTETADKYGPVCLGYFNRVDVKCIHQFRDYVRIASKHEAARACSRKQLLLRKRQGLHEQIDLRDSTDAAPGELPFFSAEDEQKYAIGCCSVFSIRDGACKREAVQNNQCGTRKELAKLLYEQINRLRDESNFKFAILEMLGTEDLCLIILTNRYQCISAVISEIQLFSSNIAKKTEADCPQYIIDNMHSILMIDREHTELIPDDGWEGIQAEIRFSLRSASGLHYLREVEGKLKEDGVLRTGESVQLAGCTGEYDAILHCPARLLVDKLFGTNGFFHPDNQKYRKSVYQSETFTAPLGIYDCLGDPLPEDDDCASRTELNQVVDNAIQALRDCFGFEETDLDFDYLELPIWRLLKDYWSFASFPLNRHLREDLKTQLIVSINAIVREAELRVKAGEVDRFLMEYDRIVDALGASMQAGSQQDRWNFGEQRSYIQNIDSYYKILRCYYGMIKDMITLLYRIRPEQEEDQPVLIPLLSFGVQPIIQSNRFHSYIHDRDAQLICIKLPYQALANPPKYLGVLAHEIFHYAKPSDRARRNQLMLKTLIRVALSEFISVLARTQGYAANQDYWKQFFTGDDSDRRFFDHLVDQTYEAFEEALCKRGSHVNSLKLNEIKGIVLPEVLFFSNNPSEEKNYSFYYTIWENIRNMMRNNLKTLNAAALQEDSCKVWRRIFGLDETTSEMSSQEIYREIMSRVGITYVKDLNNLLYSTLKAMEECPPDIFDLETVVADKPDSKKIEQFLWQIHGTKREFMMKNRKKTPAHMTQETGILGNEIRMAMIITFYLKLKPGDNAVSKLKGVLEGWAPKAGNYSDSLDKVREEFISEFQYVNDRFEGILDENTEICNKVAEDIRALYEDPDCKAIMQRLTKMYEGYFKILERRQRGHEDTSERIYQNELFELCGDLIDEYQSQATFEIPPAVSASTNRQSTDELEEMDCVDRNCCRLAHTSADLSYAVGIACDQMKIAGEIPVLWYRGQCREDWLTLPNIMRLKQMNSADTQPKDFKTLLKDEMRWAKSHILPQGMEYSDAEWLAYLQHYEFKTSVLDFSESLYPALYFATEEWEDRDGFLPEKNAVILVFNPILFNLAMRFLEALEEDEVKRNNAISQLEEYLKNGTQFDQPPLFTGNSIDKEYQYLFNFSHANDKGYPRAVLVPRHCDRMDKQSGEFIYYGVGTPRHKERVGGTTRYQYDWYSLEKLHDRYRREYAKTIADKIPFVPFLFRIELNRHRYVGFKEHLRSVGLQKYSVYPEHDKLAFDIKKQLKME